MTELTKEQVKFFIETMTDDMHNTTQHEIAETILSKFDECESLESKLLAYEQAAEHPAARITWDGSEFSVSNVSEDFLYGGTAVYLAPVLPKQPEQCEVSQKRLEVIGYGSVPASISEQRSMARALLSAQPVSEPYKLPSGYALVPCKLTAENGAKSCMIGEFTEQTEISCPECFGDDECETCDGSGMIEVTVPVSWTTIKDIWAKGIEHFAAAPAQESE